MIDLIELLRADGWSMHFVASHWMSERRYIRTLQQMGVAVHDGSKLRVEELLAAGRFDLALLTFWRVAEIYAPKIRRVSPRTRIVVDSVDLHFVRKARRLLRETADGRIGTLDSAYGSETVRELNVYASADAVLTVSQKEADLLNDLMPGRRVAYSVPQTESCRVSPVPLSERRGIVFMGSFRHDPNVGAAEFLCREVVPRLDPALTSRHPVYILGEKLDETVRRFGEGLPQVRMVGWVPSVAPYLERALVSVIPLLYGAGTKRKLLQTLMTGTPAVSTSVGVEGFDLRDGEHVLIADDPARFAVALTRLASDDALWQRLSREGRQFVTESYGREAVHARLREVLAAVMAAGPRAAALAAASRAPQAARMDMQSYHRMRTEIQECVRASLPADATVIVVSRGDEELLKLNGRTTWHFPQTADGRYAGHYPADSADAIAQIEALRAKGGRYVLFPGTALWWLDHYRGLAEHLAAHGREVCRRADVCVVYELVSKQAAEEWSPARIESLRPRIVMPWPRSPGGTDPSVLVAGIYLADKPNAVRDIVDVLDGARHATVTQRWLALGGEPPSARVKELTAEVLRERVPKFELLNRLIKQEDLARHDYVVIIDDDVVLPRGFLDEYLAAQSQLGFAIAQPARTLNSSIDHPIVEQQFGVQARQTLFVEIGPVVSFHRSVFDSVFPFDSSSPMGWGYSNIWPEQISACGASMGIIDNVPVDHSLRPTLANYGRDVVERQRSVLLNKHTHLATEQCYRVLDVAVLEEGRVRSQPVSTAAAPPRISVIIPTFNRAALLQSSLDSLASQSIGRQLFEVVVVDDGSTDATREVCRRFAPRLALHYCRIGHSGIAAAKNLGIFLAQAPLVLFFDDDDAADGDLLLEHVRSHAEHPQEDRAVLGYTAWSPLLNLTPVMEYVTDIGHSLFAYRPLRHGQLLDFSYLWGGRSSCKRSFLTRNGIHNQRFLNMQDVELGYRLSKFGLKVVYNRNAVSFMIRPITFDEFCRRCERQGRAQYLLSRVHGDPAIQTYCKLVPGAEENWREMSARLDERVARVHALEAAAEAAGVKGKGAAAPGELRSLYEWTFKAFKVKGIVEAVRSDGGGGTAALPAGAASPEEELRVASVA